MFKGKDDAITRCQAANGKVTHGTINSVFSPTRTALDIEKSKSKPKNTAHKKLNVDAKEYRPQRTAAAIADIQTRYHSRAIR